MIKEKVLNNSQMPHYYLIILWILIIINLSECANQRHQLANNSLILNSILKSSSSLVSNQTEQQPRNGRFLFKKLLNLADGCGLSKGLCLNSLFGFNSDCCCNGNSNVANNSPQFIDDGLEPDYRHRQQVSSSKTRNQQVHAQKLYTVAKNDQPFVRRTHFEMAKENEKIDFDKQTTNDLPLTKSINKINKQLDEQPYLLLNENNKEEQKLSLFNVNDYLKHLIAKQSLDDLKPNGIDDDEEIDEFYLMDKSQKLIHSNIPATQSKTINLKKSQLITDL